MTPGVNLLDQMLASNWSIISPHLSSIGLLSPYCDNDTMIYRAARVECVVHLTTNTRTHFLLLYYDINKHPPTALACRLWSNVSVPSHVLAPTPSARSHSTPWRSLTPPRPSSPFLSIAMLTRCLFISVPEQLESITDPRRPSALPQLAL